MKKKVALVVHNIRSCHNVGSILRSADGLGVSLVYLTGYTPYPIAPKDTRLPHIAKRAADQIAKTALGAEKSIAWEHYDDVIQCLTSLQEQGFGLVALEQTAKSQPLAEFRYTGALALIVGSELGGLDEQVLELADVHLEIPMLGAKESLNVASVAAIALYHLRFIA
jgi:23S rRNA (guanosine2251-2'-O)-methyltransferase